ncbi:Hypothetical protein MVR_LOCUS393 [uncultured virus]|nr:Hypothetical protein MVR_LOCUS393 [uncultured virus]
MYELKAINILALTVLVLETQSDISGYSDMIAWFPVIVTKDSSGSLAVETINIKDKCYSCNGFLVMLVVEASTIQVQAAVIKQVLDVSKTRQISKQSVA